MIDMIHEEDIKRTKDIKIRRLENLAKACAEAKDNDMKTMWFNKLIELGKKYKMSDYVTRKLIH